MSIRLKGSDGWCQHCMTDEGGTAAAVAENGLRQQRALLAEGGKDEWAAAAALEL